MALRYQKGPLTILESPSEDCRALQQKGLKADGGGTLQSSWHSYHPSLRAVTAFLQKTERNGEKPVSPLPPYTQLLRNKGEEPGNSEAGFSGLSPCSLGEEDLKSSTAPQTTAWVPGKGGWECRAQGIS